MAKRYVPNGPFVAIDNKGRRRHFNPDHRHQDGTTGYEKSELKGLSKQQLASFRVVEVSGKGVLEGLVEEATAEPGTKRTTTRSKRQAVKAEPTEGTDNDTEESEG